MKSKNKLSLTLLTSILLIFVSLIFLFTNFSNNYAWGADASSSESVFAYPSSSGSLHTDNTRIYDADNNKVVLRGLTIKDADNVEYINSSNLKKMKDEWNINVVRLSVSFAETDLYSSKNSSVMKEKLRNEIQAAIENDLYVIIDISGAAEVLNSDAFLETFTELSGNFYNSPNVIFETGISGGSSYGSSAIINFFNRVYRAVEGSNRNFYIVDVSTLDDLDEVNRLVEANRFKNIVCGVTYKSDNSANSMVSTLSTSFDSNDLSNYKVPVFIVDGKFQSQENSDVFVNEQSAAMYQSLVDHQISFCLGDFNYSNDPSAMLLSSGGSYESLSLTKYGMFCKGALNGQNVYQCAENTKKILSFTDFALYSFSHVQIVWLIIVGLILIFLAINRVFKQFVFNPRTRKNTSYEKLILSRKDKDGSKDIYNHPIDFKVNITMAIFLFFSIVYLLWRPLSLPFWVDVASFVFGCILFLTELISFIHRWKAIRYYQLARDYALPTIEEAEYPDVDVLVCTYNEDISVLQKTLIRSKNMTYPDVNKVHIYLCDDGNRAEMKKLAQQIGVNYIARRNNSGAKAGNLNNALKYSSSPYIVIFDADILPNRNFLIKTIPYFVDAEKINSTLNADEQIPLGFIQTPQNYYNKSALQRNLNCEDSLANSDQIGFYKDIQPSYSRSNSVILCGSNCVLSREALNSVGGFDDKTVCEDIVTGAKIQEAGYVSISIAENLAYGLNPLSYHDLIIQRKRWISGAMVMLRKSLNIFKNKFTKEQFDTYVHSAFFWLYPLKSMVFLFMPIVCLLFSCSAFICNTESILVFWLPMFLLTIYLFNFTTYQTDKSVFGVVDQYATSFALLPTLIKEMLGLKARKFKVTNKSFNKTNRFSTAVHIVFPMLTLILSIFCVVVALIKIICFNYYIHLILLFWLIRNCFILFYVVFYIVDKPNNNAEINVMPKHRECQCEIEGKYVEGHLFELSDNYIKLRLDYKGGELSFGQLINVKFEHELMCQVDSSFNNYDENQVLRLRILEYSSGYFEYFNYIHDNPLSQPDKKFAIGYAKVFRSVLERIFGFRRSIH